MKLTRCILCDDLLLGSFLFCPTCARMMAWIIASLIAVGVGLVTWGMVRGYQ